jgi:hypothetical protein
MASSPDRVIHETPSLGSALLQTHLVAMNKASRSDVVPELLHQLLSRIVYESLFAKDQCSGLGPLFLVMHPEIQDTDALLRRAAHILLEARSSNASVEAAMCDALPLFNDAHIRAVREWWQAEAAKELGEEATFKEASPAPEAVPQNEGSPSEAKDSEGSPSEAKDSPENSGGLKGSEARAATCSSPGCRHALAPNGDGDESPCAASCTALIELRLAQEKGCAEGIARRPSHNGVSVPWGKFMDAAGKIYHADQYGCVRWVWSDAGLHSASSPQWTPTPVRFRFLDSRCGSASLSSRTLTVHRVEAIRPVFLPTESFTPTLATAVLDVDELMERPTCFALEVPARQIPAGATLGVFCRHRTSVGRHVLQCDDPVLDPERYSFPSDFLAPGTVIELVVCLASSAASLRPLLDSAPSLPARLEARLLCDEVLVSI